VSAYGYSGGDGGVGTNPHVIAYYHRLGAHSLSVYAAGGIGIVVVEGAHYNALCQIHFVADGDGGYQGIVQSYARVVTYDEVAHGIVDATEIFHHGTIAQDKLVEWQYVATHAPVYDSSLSTLGKQRKAPAQPPTGARLYGVNHAAVQSHLPFGMLL
jgi:hypothetical protein